MLHLTIMSSYFTMKSTIYPGWDFCPFLGKGPFFTLLWLSVTILDGVSRRTENCTVAQGTPFTSRAVVNKPQMRHADSTLKILLLVLYSEDKNSILISKAIKLTLQIIKFRPQKQEKKRTSFIPANDTMVCGPTFQGTWWESGRTTRQLPKQGTKCV